MSWIVAGVVGVSAAGSIYSSNKNAEAAENAANIQADSAKEAAAMQAAATERQRQDLMPFADLGKQAIPMQQQAMANQQALFNDPMSVMQNPMFQAIQQQNQQNIMQNSAIRGRLDTGGTQTALQDSALRTGFDILNQERNAALANSASLLNQVTVGSNAAAGQASALGQGTQIQGNLMTDAAAAQAAGIVGSANAQTAGVQNALNAGLTGLMAYQPQQTTTQLQSPTIGGGASGQLAAPTQTTGFNIGLGKG